MSARFVLRPPRKAGKGVIGSGYGGSSSGCAGTEAQRRSGLLLLGNPAAGRSQMSRLRRKPRARAPDSRAPNCGRLGAEEGSVGLNLGDSGHRKVYGGWLHDQHGFLHVDMEKGGFERLGLKGVWDGIAFLPPPSLQPLLAALTFLRAPVVLDWGLPPRWLPLVEAMHGSGIQASWFDGDHDAARHVFAARGAIDAEGSGGAARPDR